MTCIYTILYHTLYNYAVHCAVHCIELYRKLYYNVMHFHCVVLYSTLHLNVLCAVLYTLLCSIDSCALGYMNKIIHKSFAYIRYFSDVRVILNVWP